MHRVSIYITEMPAKPSKYKRLYGYRLSCMWRGKEKTVEGFGEVEGTQHKATLTAICEALGRLNQSCEVHLHCEDEFILNMIDTNLERWAGNEFRTAKGEPVKHQEEWREVWRLTRGQLIKTEKGPHPYGGWLKREMEARKNV